MYILENEFLTAKFKSLGAEWTSLKSKSNGLEYVWQADPEIWAKHAPNLFPIVGKVANNQYTYEGKKYDLGQHGFARDSEFQVETQEKESITFLLKSSEVSLIVFPFDFEFRIKYSLKGNSLHTKYKVSNPSKEKFWFSVGAHPAFNIPLGDGGAFSDYFIEFEKLENVGRFLIEGGLISKQTTPALINSNILPLSKELFLEDALVFKELKSTSMTIRSKKNNHFVKMDFAGFPFFGIWTKPGFDKYLCLEPWCGIADSVGGTGVLNEKEGIHSLASNESWDREFVVTVG